MVRKSLVVTFLFLLATLGLASSGGLVASAWSSTASYTCLGTSVTSNCTGQSNPSFPVGTTVTDTAVIKDPNGIFGQCNKWSTSGCVTGDVIFTIYQGGTCSGTVVNTSGQIPPTGKNYPGIFSETYTFTSAGSYSFKAAYKGNYNDENGWYILPCEPLTITKASPNIVTSLSSASIVVGNSVYDTATISAGYNPTGTVQYEYFSGSSCGGSPTNVGSAVQITRETIPSSNSQQFNSAGSYSWMAVYGGDQNNNKESSACEPLTVSLASPTITTALSSLSVVVQSGTVTDTATLSGATANAGGTISFYYTSGGSCTSTSGLTPVATDTVTGSVTSYSSGTQTMPNAGSYNWFAVYSGDSNNKVAYSACEPLTVTQTTPTLTTSLVPSTAKNGGSVYDTATLTGVTSSAGGWITFYYSATPITSCSGTSPGVMQVGLPVSVNGPGTYNSASQPFSKGTYYWFAVYSGDANNGVATSGCSSEQLTVTPQFPLGSILAILAPLGAIGLYLGSKKGFKPY